MSAALYMADGGLSLTITPFNNIMLAPNALALNQIIDRRPLTVTPETPVSQVVALMSAARTSCVLVAHQQRLVGIFTERDVVKLAAASISLASVEIAAVMTQQIIALTESEAQDIMSVISRLRQHRIRHLPIINSTEELVGIITHESIRAVLQPADLLKLRRVGEVMTTQVMHAPVTASVLSLTQLMSTYHVSCVVIVEKESEKLLRPVGIITERDIVQLQSQGVDLTETQAHSVMSTPLLPTRPDELLWSAHQQMQQHRIRRLVVVGDAGELLGLITQSSLLSILDPIEICTALDSLQRVVEEQTTYLRIANERLHSEIISRQRAQTALQNQIAFERLVGAIATRIRQSLNLEIILNTTVSEVRQFLQTERVFIYRFEPDWSGCVCVESVADDYPSILGENIQDTCFVETYVPLYKKGRIVATNDIYNAGLAPCHVNLLAQFQVRANLVAPILQGEDLWGMLIAHQCSGARQWQQLEIDLFRQLVTQVAIAIQQAQLYQQLEAANVELRRLASLDGLTQLANRRCFDEALSVEWQRHARDGIPLSLILCDVDFFKLYNDTYGHLAGDDCLQQIASAIRNAVHRPGDVVARYGGEEFAVILPNTNSAGAMQVAQKIYSGVKALFIAHKKSPICSYVTLSLGVASMVPEPKAFPALLIGAADKALYNAKDKGRARIIFNEIEIVSPDSMKTLT